MKVTRLKNIESTNQYLQNLLDEGRDVVDNVVVADFQTSGKGQGKNVWESEAGKNLLFSVALDMSFLKAEEQFLLTQMISVAMINVLEKYLPKENLSVKWPNDIYFNDRKIAGVLIKNEIKGMMLGTSIIGIGLNVNQIVFDENIPNPISMKMITGKDYDLKEILSDIICDIDSKVESRKSRENDSEIVSCTSSIVNFYTSYLYRYRQWALYEHEGAVKEMMIIGYDRFGRLILKEKNDREVVCDIKEISFKI